MKLILGSQSPRRKEILSFFSYPFETLSPPFDESSVPFTGDPEVYAKALSQGKSGSLETSDVLFTADTIVFKEGQLLLKPADEAEGFEMLKTLNGAWHTVYTAVTARLGAKMATLVEKTDIKFHRVSEAHLKLYHNAFNGLDKAGGYGIQEGGSIIIERIEGCFYNVMGLPLHATAHVLEEMGIDLWHHLKSS